jgi:hypothetical protein
MKKTKILAVILAGSLLFQSCATVFGGKINDCQKHKPAHGEPKRQIRVVPFILDLGGLVWLVVDFATGAIYKPCPTPPAKK